MFILAAGYSRPNQSLEPMARSVTRPADAGRAPALTMAHHQTLGIKMSTQIETLKSWSHALFWASVIFPLIGVAVGVARYYENQKEKTKTTTQTRKTSDASAKEIERLRVLASERRLSSDQMNFITSVLRAAGEKTVKLDVTAANGDGEAQRYAMDFVRSFRAAGFSSDLVLPIPGMRPEISGTFLSIRDEPVASPLLAKLREALEGANIDFKVVGMEQNFLPDHAFVLAIGAKRTGD